MSADANRRPGRSPGIVAVVAATTTAQVVVVMGSSVFPVIAPELATRFGVEASLVGYQVSLIYGMAMATSPLTSSVVLRWGACRAMQIGLMAGTLAIVLAMTANLPALIAASVLLGFAMSVMQPASAHLLFRFSPPENRNLIFSLKQTGVPIGWALMAAVAPAVTIAFGWKWALAVVLLSVAATALVIQRWREAWDDDRRTAPTERQSLLAGLRLVWHYPALRRLSLMSHCYAFVQLSVATFAVTMLVQETGYSLIAAGFLVSLMYTMGVLGRIVWGWVADVTGNSRFVLVALGLIMTACSILLAFVSAAWPGWAVILLFVIFGATGVAWNGIFVAETARFAPRGQVSTAIGGAMVWNFGGVLAGPALFATVYKLVGSYAATFGLLAVVSACGLAFVARAAATERAAERRREI